ncbi:MAG: hypothetical protein BWY84_00952 [Candidatus Aerophobetes bacterium ADurb.Bin490]|nr:MAG: hypothetical protein BWY84_00952 [Candidatus Aerophobetes bacterium ADurb.Bin490]
MVRSPRLNVIPPETEISSSRFARSTSIPSPSLSNVTFSLSKTTLLIPTLAANVSVSLLSADTNTGMLMELIEASIPPSVLEILSTLSNSKFVVLITKAIPGIMLAFSFG